MYIGFILNGRNELEYCRILSSDVNDLDRRFGEFCFSQVRGQLKGAYLPEERIYCIKAAGEDGNRVESLVRDIIDRGAWPSDDYQRLRDIGFVHETADSYRRTDSRDFIVGELERTLHNGRAGRLLEAYHDFHRSREKDTGNRVLTAIQTGQGVLLFDDTVMGNIRLGRRDATDEEVLAAARAANCDEFVSRMPQGYDTMIGENGSKLSGGERQRISIARALLKDAPIVLLDEATASLDVENETVVQQALSRLLAGKTVIVIAHRMRTVENADKIVVLKDGVVAEQGIPAQLKAAGGEFARMVALQKEAAAWQL